MSFYHLWCLPLYTSLEKIENSLLEAAADLGAPPWKAFLRVTLPLSVPGMIAGTILTFIPAMGMFVVPDILGGAKTILDWQCHQKSISDCPRLAFWGSSIDDLDANDHGIYAILHTKSWVW